MSLTDRCEVNSLRGGPFLYMCIVLNGGVDLVARWLEDDYED